MDEIKLKTFGRLNMKIDRLNESELEEILAIAQEEESKLKEMSDYATILSEKWRVKISKSKNSN